MHSISTRIRAAVCFVLSGASVACSETSPQPLAAALPGECSPPKANWIFCDDFEQDRIASYFEADNSGAFERTASVGHDSSWGMRARFGAGTVGAGSLKIAFGKRPFDYFRAVDRGTAVYRDVYWRLYVKHAPGWTGGGGDKLSRITVFSSPSSWAQAMVGHVWSGGPGSNHLVIDPASGTNAAGQVQTTTYNDGPNFRWLGYIVGTTPMFDAAHVGTWYCVEARVKLNDPGQSNGLFELWINDSLDARKTGLNWLGSFTAYGLNAIFLENYWNAGSPVAQERYIDRFVVSTAPIGC